MTTKSRDEISRAHARWGKRRYWVFFKGLLACFSLSALVLLPLWKDLLFSSTDFHHATPASVDYLAGLVLNGIAFLGLTAAFYTFRSFSTRNRRRLGLALLSLILFSQVFNPLRHYIANNYLPRSFQHLFWFKAFPFFICIAVLLWAQRVYFLMWRLILFSSPFSVLVVGYLLIGLIRGDGKEMAVIQGKTSSPGTSIANRVVWILFDELDFRLAFPERPKSLQLPNFDRFASSSFRFTNAIPPSIQTLLSVPSLIDGVVYTAAFPTGSNRLMLRDSAGELSPWGSRSNVFTDLKALGGRTAVVGWYLPYSRIFGSIVDYSHWAAYSPERFIGLGLDLPSTLVAHLRGILPVVRKSLHGETQRELEVGLDQLITDPSLQLCFLHLPAPHLPTLGGINSRNGGIDYFNDVRAYFGNLEVADGVLGRCLDAVEKSPVASNTTVIVSSDHPWRVSELYDGKSDPRVPFMVRFPGQRQGFDRGTPVRTVETRALIHRIIRATALVESGTNSPLLENSIFGE